MAYDGAFRTSLNGNADEYKHHQFPPGSAAEGAHISSREQYDQLYAESIENPDKFWGKIAEDFHWQKRWQTPVRRSAICHAFLTPQQLAS